MKYITEEAFDEMYDEGYDEYYDEAIDQVQLGKPNFDKIRQFGKPGLRHPRQQLPIPRHLLCP